MKVDQIPELRELIRKSVLRPDLSTTDRALLENVVMEERVNQLRHKAFSTAIGDGPWSTIGSFALAHKVRYLRERIDLSRDDPGVPDTFDAELNEGNFWTGIEENLALYRIEDARFALKGSGVDEKELERAIRDRQLASSTVADRNAAEAVLSRVCDAWNASRDQRPAFATTEPEIEELLSDTSPEWANVLRDHLGLGHLNPMGGGEPIKVLLMRYTAKEVSTQANRAGHGGFCIPTVLDGVLSPFFFPTPLPAASAPNAPQRCGRTLNLRQAATQADYVMGLELMHSFVNYRPEHLVRWGLISRPLAVDLSLLRRLHLDWLRLDTERDEFGCDLTGV